MFRHQRWSAGFATYEIIIVVAVLGLALVLTMKGVVLVEAARTYLTVSQIRQYQDRVQIYYDRYNAFPGDDAQAPRRWGRQPSLFMMFGAGVSFAGDRRIQGELSDYANPTGEQFMAWQDLRRANLIEGDKELLGQSAMPDNYFGGVFGFAEANLGIPNALCLTRIPGAAAEKLDGRLDDGNMETGAFRATSAWDLTGAKNTFPSPESGPYVAEKTYIICMPQML